MVLANALVEMGIAAYALVVWAAMIFFPNHRKTRQFLNTSLPLWPLLIAYAYFALTGLKINLNTLNPIEIIYGMATICIFYFVALHIQIFYITVLPPTIIISRLFYYSNTNRNN